MKCDRSNKFNLLLWASKFAWAKIEWASKHFWGVTFILLAMVHYTIICVMRLKVTEKSKLSKYSMIYQLNLGIN